MKNDWITTATAELSAIKLNYNMKMSECTTFKIGGPAEVLAEPQNVRELQQLIDFCNSNDVPFFILGMGSNLLVRDGGVKGMIIRLSGDFCDYKIDGVSVVSGAGVAVAELSKALSAQGLSGLEYACGIPGSVGGAVFMNAGAYDGETADVVEWVDVCSADGEIYRVERDELKFAYRHSRFQETGEIILSVGMCLKLGDSEENMAKVIDYTDKRNSKQPLEDASAGSTFRRPEGHYVGPMIEEAGLKGFSIGGAQVSLKHAGFVINRGNATAEDVLALIEHVREVIKEKYGVDLQPEVRVIGER